MTNIQNPVLPGFNPDPSFVRVGDDYYIATSTFEWFPGICIHHSTDLMNWEISSYALTDENEFNIMGMDTACGIWAPNLTYDQGVFYLIYTIVYTNRHRFKDTHNFLVTAEDIQGPWSKPIPLNRTGFDPSLFHDPSGKKWLVNMLFDYRLDHKRFGGVGIQEYDSVSKRMVGEPYNIFRGSEIGTTEGPNIFYHDGYYYLMTAEGGTGFDHCTTLCRARDIKGPYEACPYNPILTAAGKEDMLLKRAGHGQVVQGKDGSWFMAHLCSRTIDNCSILGRETAIQNMTLTEDGWFKISGNDSASPEEFFRVEADVKREPEKSGFVDFGDGEIPLDYMTLRQSKETCGIQVTNGNLEITGGNALASKFNQGFLARRQQHFSYDFTVRMSFEPENFNHMAGIACYYNYDNYYYLFISRNDEGRRCMEVLTSENKKLTESQRIQLNDEQADVFLRAEARGAELRFYYALEEGRYQPIGGVLDMRMISDERIDGNGFTGAMVGVSCQDLCGSGVKAYVKWMNYESR